MGIFKTIEDLNNARESATQSTGGSRKSFFNLNDKEKFRIRFLQELTEDADNFDEDKGTALAVAVHQAPHDYKKKLGCTIEDSPEFKCWAHEQIPFDKRWSAKQRVVINVAVLEKDGKDDVWSAKILDQTFSPKHVVTTLIEYATAYGTITDRYYSISRSGSGASDTSYNLIPLEEAKALDEITVLELNDLTTVYRKLPYDEQEDFFLAESKQQASSSKW